VRLLRSLLAVTVLLVVGCGDGDGADTAQREIPPTTEVPSTTVPSTTVPTTTVPTTTVPTTTVTAAFDASTRGVTAEELGPSWRPGCPVEPDELAAIDIVHWVDPGRTATGTIIVAEEVGDDVVAVFATLFEQRFPIASLRPVTEFQADDDRSMAADNSSGFNCRTIAGTDRYSEHAYGTAIDLNPIRNPYVTGSTVLPPSGEAYLDRSDVRPGMITAGDDVVSAFNDIGWGWGGDWRNSKDYQHFSATGR